MVIQVRRLQKAVLYSHEECQEYYREGEETLSEQLSELTQYVNIFERLLKKAQALVRPLFSEINQLQRASHLALLLMWETGGVCVRTSAGLQYWVVHLGADEL